MTEYISPFAADLIGFAGSFFIVAAFAYSNLHDADERIVVQRRKLPWRGVADHFVDGEFQSADDGVGSCLDGDCAVWHHEGADDAAR